MQKNTDWDAAACLLKGVYLTLRKSPFIVHATPLRSLVTTCQVRFFFSLCFRDRESSADLLTHWLTRSVASRAVADIGRHVVESLGRGWRISGSPARRAHGGEALVLGAAPVVLLHRRPAHRHADPRARGELPMMTNRSVPPRQQLRTVSTGPEKVLSNR